MIISHKYKFIFVHIPKTAGMSIKNSLINVLGDLDILTGPQLDLKRTQQISYVLKNQDINVSAHTSTSNATRQMLDGKEYFKFAFVRNPWDRLVSLYFYLKETSVYNIPCDNPPSFNQWILSDLDKFKDDMPLSVLLRHKKRPQLEWITNQKGNISVDFIGKFENIKNDFNTFLDKCNIPHVPLLNENKTKHDHYTKYYTMESIKKVSNWYKKDISYFNYKFGE